jgi:hypothetical protein
MVTEVDKKRAWHKIGKATQKGVLVRPRYCQYCYLECKTQGHHLDYLRPLEVIWLCPQCHTDEHLKMKEDRFMQEVVNSAKRICYEPR